ncbi:response regulator [Sphingomonas gilva]|uniref:protein-glutamate methylesterase n=2 Tax=Sphingomonas gilva TaxID=2305907 RepID=A0A396RK54_9SPHN|nr:response regulator [Sphingomonas gilva]
MLSPRAVEPESVVLPETRVLIVDDSAVARAVFARICAECPGVAIVGSLCDASAALSFLARERVDLILLDIDMPGTDGLSALPDLLAAAEGARIIVVSASCEEGGAAAVQAMALGAADTLAKPAPGSFGTGFSTQLADRIARLANDTGNVVSATPEAEPETSLKPFDVIAISASTGGIHALSQLLRAVPRDLTTPILVTQHLPPSFMPYFAAQLSLLAGRPSTVATDRQPVLPGRVYVAPGDAHMTVAKSADGEVQLRLQRLRAASGCMPSADPMLASLAKVYGAQALAITLSGMGRDGAMGAAALAETGAQILVQDAESSVIWGMPGAVARAGHATAVLPPDRIGALIAGAVR